MLNVNNVKKKIYFNVDSFEQQNNQCFVLSDRNVSYSMHMGIENKDTGIDI